MSFWTFFSFNAPAGYIGTALDIQMVAVSIALQQLQAFQHKFENAVFFSDSQAAIQSISSAEFPLKPEFSRYQELLRVLNLKGKRIILQWVSAHFGVWGNEQADFLAKKWRIYYKIQIQQFPFGKLNCF